MKKVLDLLLGRRSGPNVLGLGKPTRRERLVKLLTGS